MNDRNNVKFEFSVDLFKHARQHIRFLRGMHALGVTFQIPSLHSLKRYKDLWLPMLVYNNNNNNNNPNNKELVPPSDIAWLWHCHRLAPFCYVEYLQHEYGAAACCTAILEATPPFCFQVHQAVDDEKNMLVGEGFAAFDNNNDGISRNDDDEFYLTNTSKQQQQEKQTRELWSQLYPKEPFFISTTSSNNNNNNNNTATTNDNNNNDLYFLNGFDLLGSTQRQATFLWQVSGERFDNDIFLLDAVEKYYKFLQLRKNKQQQQQQQQQQRDNQQSSNSASASASHNQHIIIVPTYQIDLMWHTHMLASLTLYYKDCQEILGYPLHHDDSLNDRIEGGKLDVAFQATKALWLEEYGEPYFVSGGMYRGEPPTEFFQSHWTPTNMDDSNSSCVIPTGPFLKMIGVQGATSTNPTSVTGTAAAVASTSAAKGILQYTDTGGNNSKPPQFPGDLLVPHHNKTGKWTPICAYFCFRGHSCRNGDKGCQFCHVRNIEDLPTADRATFSQWVDIEPGVTWAGPPNNDNNDDDHHYAVADTPLLTQWTSLNGVYGPTGQAGFVASSEKSKTRGTNANPSKDDYIFGRHGLTGIGYYHHTTQEAYVILEQRIANRVRQEEVNVICNKCCVGMFTCGLGNPKSIQDREEGLEELKLVEEIVGARAKADVPMGVVGISAQLAKMDKNKKRLYDTYYSDAGYWYFPTSCYTAGGGCGASGGAGGGGCGGAGGTHKYNYRHQYCRRLFIRPNCWKLQSFVCGFPHSSFSFLCCLFFRLRWRR
jgi:hypothetical protein